MDPSRMGHALEPGKVTFDEKLAVRKAIEDAKIPFTYVSANCFAGYFVGNLCQMETLVPPRDKVFIYGDGTSKGTYILINTTFLIYIDEYCCWFFYLNSHFSL